MTNNTEAMNFETLTLLQGPFVAAQYVSLIVLLTVNFRITERVKAGVHLVLYRGLFNVERGHYV